MKLAGGQIVCESLIREGVDLVFGHPGGAILPLYDHLTGYPQIKHVLSRHEQGAAHAADGYARATGKVGVCFGTSGPGAINLVVGLATAYMDSTPIVAITGQVPRAAIGKDAFQETDITGITLPVVKHNYLVMKSSEIAETIKEAFHIARTGRPGPVLVDIPRDVLQEITDFTEYPDSVDLPGYKPVLDGHPTQIRKAAKMINEAKRPVILAGRGVLVSGAEQELLALAEKAQLPVIQSLLGIGAFPGSHYLNISLMGMHGSAFANLAADEADLIINIGARFDDRIVGRVSDFAQKAKIIHITIDPSSVNQNVHAHVPIVGDAKRVLAKLVEQVESANRAEWLNRIDQLRREHPLVVPESDKVLQQFVIQKLWEETKGDAIVVTGVGQHQMWAAQFYLAKHPRSFITSGGLGTMGYEVPAAIGAQMGRPDALVWSICGDGGFQMTLQELAVVRDEKLPIKYAIMDNTYLGMVRQWQELFYGKRYSAVDVRGPDWVKLAEAYDIKGIRVTRKDEVPDAIREANAHPGAVIVDFVVEPETNVYPMIPAGQSVKEMVEDPWTQGTRSERVSR
jgi:acetolactate synthase-1/2/3 large subunit